MNGPILAQVEPLHNFVETIFGSAGFRPEHAKDAANVLMYASRRGVDTHGVRNLIPIYFAQLDKDLYTLNPNFRIEHETAVSARVNGDSGLGLAASSWAMRLAISKAKDAGMAFVSMRNTYHYGAAGYYPWMALQNDMIGISMTGRFSPDGTFLASVPPTYSAIPMFSTNPLAIGFPTAEEPPYLLDMATSTVPFNRIFKMRDAGEPIPLGWGLDERGEPTTDAALVRQVLPLGGTREQGGHKGYGLAMMVEVLCAVLSGGWGTGFPLDDPSASNGHKQITDAHFFGAMRVDAFRPLDEFKRGMDAMIQALHAAPKEEGQDRIYVAGEIEDETEQERLRNGIPLPDTVVEDLKTLSTRYHVPLPF